MKEEWSSAKRLLKGNYFQIRYRFWLKIVVVIQHSIYFQQHCDSLMHLNNLKKK